MQDMLGLYDKERHSNIGSCLCITISRNVDQNRCNKLIYIEND